MIIGSRNNIIGISIGYKPSIISSEDFFHFEKQENFLDITDNSYNLIIIPKGTSPPL